MISDCNEKSGFDYIKALENYVIPNILEQACLPIQKKQVCLVAHQQNETY